MESFNIENPDAPDFKISIIEIFKKVVWTDIPILLTIFLYLILFIFAFKTRKNKAGRTIVFGICLLWTLSLDYLTKLMEKNWEILGFSDNYFDEFGIFSSFFFALPPLFIAIFLLSTLIGNVADKIIFVYRYKHSNQENEEIKTSKQENENENNKEENNESDGKTEQTNDEGKIKEENEE